MKFFVWLFGNKEKPIPLKVNGNIIGWLTVINNDATNNLNGKNVKVIVSPEKINIVSW